MGRGGGGSRTAGRARAAHAGQKLAPKTTVTGNATRTADLSKKEYLAVREYGGEDGFRDINALARTGRITADPTMSAAEARRHTREIDAALGKSHTTADRFVYRGIGREDVDQIRAKGHLAKGSTWSDPGFLSTTSKRAVTVGFGGPTARSSTGTLIKIRVPKGTQALDLDYHLAGAGERELLLGRNTKLRIVSTRRTRHGATIIRADVIP